MKKKNIFLGLLLVSALGITSCDMEKYPYDAIEESLYMKNVSDFASARIGIYSSYRSLTSGTYVLNSEFQCDDFQATAGFSNTYGNMYRWDFQPSDGTIEGIWSGNYSAISRCNYFLDSYQKVLNGEVVVSDADKELISAYAGEAYFTRAFCYYMLSTYFCNAYTESNAENSLGLPLQLHYNSNATDNTKYPGRSTLKATFEQIYKDIVEAEKLVDETKVVNKTQNPVNYITKNLVKALRARVSLWTKNYDDAITASTTLISSNNYPLINEADAFRSMWVQDMGSEVIWQVYLSAPDETASTNGTIFWGQYKNGGAQIMDFIPSQSLLDLYTDGEKDMRYTSFFAQYHISLPTGAEADVKVFDKYPGNPDLYEKLNVDNHYMNKPKPFRISEQYLIAAEAYAAKGDLPNASKYLNDLRRARVADYQDATFTASNINVAIQDERHKELVGEGFRFTDMKRWGLSLDRKNAYQDANAVLMPGNSNTTALSKQADDHRFVWPIPKAEYDSNPQLKGQQNPGY